MNKYPVWMHITILVLSVLILGAFDLPDGMYTSAGLVWTGYIIFILWRILLAMIGQIAKAVKE